MEWVERYSLPCVWWLLQTAVGTLAHWLLSSVQRDDLSWFRHEGLTIVFDPIRISADATDGFNGTEIRDLFSLTFKLPRWNIFHETKSQARDRLKKEAIARIEAHLQERDDEARARGLQRNPMKRPPRARNRDPYVWAVHVLVLGKSRAEVARVVGVDPRTVTASVAEIAELIGWPTQ